MLKDQILKSSYFKSLLNIASVDALAEEIVNYCEDLDVYQAGSATQPSIFLCCVFRMFTLEHTEDDLLVLLDHRESALARCVGLLYVRFTMRPDRLWESLEEYILDEMDFGALKGKMQGLPNTVGEYVQEILMKEKYFGTPLPRLPAAVRRKLEEKVAPLTIYRKRTQANKRELKRFREPATPVEVCQDGQWYRGQVAFFQNSAQGRMKVSVLLEEKFEGREVSWMVHLGKVILRDGDAGSGSDSESRNKDRKRRGRSPDWSRSKGTPDTELIKELREQAKEEAVCGHGKDYCRRPMGFESGLAIKREQGSAEEKLMQEDTLSNAVQMRKGYKRGYPEEEKEGGGKSLWRSNEEQERERKKQQIFEKYSQAAKGSDGSRGADVDGPDVMRLG